MKMVWTFQLWINNMWKEIGVEKNVSNGHRTANKKQYELNTMPFDKNYQDKVILSAFHIKSETKHGWTSNVSKFLEFG